ncbi:uncharacterized protein MYCFIDRAFT_176347 [Pseudocercospora fijiensis CIRAD86]|uniref:Uncharacterized protein n=1 Tax=Pseudocercospora fijiensis (strain CIRAD86) TaxID=383855 RepID=M2ZPH9_PSEFD|nr:uncharacterized protein MYCFIDRAFT_176347 [Pseudocercospora fijiensis CIRAD86]EME80999.1 hypothetical protein MYCFIDRAFT_176347 [Pseudocercospora fijiensis CIRAD86]
MTSPTLNVGLACAWHNNGYYRILLDFLASVSSAAAQGLGDLVTIFLLESRMLRPTYVLLRDVKRLTCVSKWPFCQVSTYMQSIRRGWWNPLLCLLPRAVFLFHMTGGICGCLDMNAALLHVKARLCDFCSEWTGQLQATIWTGSTLAWPSFVLRRDTVAWTEPYSSSTTQYQKICTAPTTAMQIGLSLQTHFCICAQTSWILLAEHSRLEQRESSCSRVHVEHHASYDFHRRDYESQRRPGYKAAVLIMRQNPSHTGHPPISIPN